MLRFDLRRYKIGVTLVCPGAVDTGLVQTLRVAGVDRSNPKVKKVEKQFVKHAITPDAAAEKLIEGTRRRAYMVYTSHDIRIGHFFQRVFPWPYELAMRALNDRLYRASREALQP